MPRKPKTSLTLIGELCRAYQQKHDLKNREMALLLGLNLQGLNRLIYGHFRPSQLQWEIISVHLLRPVEKK